MHYHGEMKCAVVSLDFSSKVRKAEETDRGMSVRVSSGTWL